MNRNGPIIIIEDDQDDQEILKEIFDRLQYPNEVKFFFDGTKALEYLNDNLKVTPFLILSDINLPKLDGFALRNKIRMDAKLQTRCIPYLFFSTSASQKAVIDAYSLSVQGFFKKESSIEELQKTIVVIMEYWYRCTSPNSFSEIANQESEAGKALK
ncbi:MAG: response regulator [Flavisolibacter sp.]